MNKITKILAVLGAVLLPLLPRQAASQTPEDADWNAARALGTVEAYQTFLNRHPTNENAGEAFRALVESTRIVEHPGIFPDSYAGGSASFGEPQIAAALY